MGDMGLRNKKSPMSRLATCASIRYECRWCNQSGISLIPVVITAVSILYPDRPFNNFRAWWPLNKWILCYSGTLDDGFCSSKNVKESIVIVGVQKSSSYPTSLLTTLELENALQDVSELQQIHWSTDFEALKLRKSSSDRVFICY